MAEDSTQPPHATRFVETTRGILSYAQLAPLLAERVLRIQEDIEDELFATRLLDEALLLDLHRGICSDLTPDWAGRFRLNEVRVGQHSPPPSHQVPMLIHDYFSDLNVRLATTSDPEDALLVETLAFAEGRLLSIHPFPDFNGRVTRLLLSEILRRTNLPPLELAPTGEEKVREYILALRAADSLSWRPLIDCWKKRLESAS